MNRPFMQNTQQGMTLIEILIALVLGTFLLAGVMQIFLSSKQSYRMQENMSRLQENGRFAMEFISRDIRMADYWGCVGSNNIQNKTKVGRFTLGFSGADNDNADNAVSGNSDQDNNGIWDGTDSFAVIGASLDNQVNLTATGGDISSGFTVAAGSQFEKDNYAVISNCISGDIFRISNDVSAGNSIEHTVDGSDVAGNNSAQLGYGSISAPDANVYGNEATIYKLNDVAYRISLSASEPVLDREIDNAGFQTLVEGIENMQIRYGVDTDADGTPNFFVDADSVADMAQVVSVRITLTARTIDNNLTKTGDGRLRRTFSSTLVLRNRLQ